MDCVCVVSNQKRNDTKRKKLQSVCSALNARVNEGVLFLQQLLPITIGIGREPPNWSDGSKLRFDQMGQIVIESEKEHRMRNSRSASSAKTRLVDSIV